MGVFAQSQQHQIEAGPGRWRHPESFPDQGLIVAGRVIRIGLAPHPKDPLRRDRQRAEEAFLGGPEIALRMVRGNTALVPEIKFDVLPIELR